MSQAGANSSSGGGGGSGIETINTIGPDGGGNYTLESTDGSVTFTPIANGLDLSVPGSVGAVTTFDIDVGGPITPVAGVVTLNGIGGNQTVTSGAGEIGFNNRRWFTQYVVNQSTTPGSDAEYTTIQAAINAAAAGGGGEVYVQSSTTAYTEDLTLIGGVNINAVSPDGRLGPYGGSTVLLVGNHTFTGEGAIIIKGMLLNNTAGTLLSQSNTAGISLVGFLNCQIISNGDFVHVDSTGTAAICSLLDTNLEANGAVGIIGVGGTFSTIGSQMQGFTGSALQVAGNVALRTSTLTSAAAAVEITGIDASAGFDYCQFGGTIGVLFTVTGGVSADNCSWDCTDSGGFYIAGAAGTYTYDNDNIQGTANQIAAGISQQKSAWRPRAQAIPAPANTSDFGTSAFDSAVFTVTDGWVSLVGGSTPPILTITPDSGGPISAIGGTINLNGIGGNVTGSSAPGEVYVDNEFWISSYVVDPSSTPGTRGSFQTIQSAITAANAAGGGQVVIRPNVNPYIEDLNFLPNVNLQGSRMDPFITANGGFGVTIQGNHTINDTAGNILLSCSDLAFISITGSNFTISATTGTVAFDFNTCTFGNEDNAGVVFDLTSTGTVFGIVKDSNVGSNGIIANVGPSCDINFFTCFSLSAQSSGFNVTGGAASLAYSPLEAPIGFNISSGTIDLDTLTMDTNTTGVLFAGGGTVHANNINWQCNGVSGFYIDGTGGTYNYINDQIDGSASQINPAITTNSSVWRPRATAGNSGTAYAGTASFDQTYFNVTDGFVTLAITPAIAFIWNTTSVNIANLSVNNGYFCISPGGTLTLGLPATSVLGDTVRVSLSGATSFQITQAAGQQIQLGSNTTTLGATGTLTSTAQGDSVELVCLTANSLWVVQSSQGNLTLT